MSNFKEGILNTENTTKLQNGLETAVFGGSSDFGPSVQLSQVATIFKNNRWYMISNMRQVLSEFYVEHGIIQTVVDVPVDDALRGGIEIKTKQLSEDEIQSLYVTIERHGDMQKLGQACKWNRLFGGAGVIIVTDQDFSSPLDINAIDKDTPLDFRAVDMWELFGSKQNVSDYAMSIDDQNFQGDYYDYYGHQVHKSRVIILKGLEAPSFVRPRLRGWGFSIIESLVRSINQYLKATDLTFEVLDEFKIDIFKINGLSDTLLQPNGDAMIRKRIALANSQKNYQHAIAMDGEDDYIQKQLSFAGISEAMSGIRMQVASDLRMPLTKIFGISAAGFSSGEDDIENYNAMIESQVRSKIKFDIITIVSLRCQQLFGFIPDDLMINYKPLRILSLQQEEEVKTQKFNRVLSAKQAGELTTEEFRDACNRDDLLPIKLDKNVDKLSLPQSTDADDDTDGVAVKVKKSVTAAKQPEGAKA